MKRLLLVALIVTGSFASALGAGEEGGKWAKEFARFDAADAKARPAEGIIELVGSSTFTRWGAGAAKALAPLPVFNRGFGGSQTADVLAAAPRYVIPYKPKVVAYYCGDNDIGAKKGPEATAKGFLDFVALVRKDLPATRFVYVGIKPSPSRWALWAQAQKANDLVKAECTPANGLYFVDLAPGLLGADGQPRPEMYVEDRLHFSEAGNAVLTAALKPVLEKAWADAAGK